MRVKTYISALAVLAILLSAPSPAMSEAEWLAEFWISYGNDSGQAIVGADRNATGNYEAGYDEEATFLSGSKITAYFYHSEWGRANNYYWMDIQDTSLPKEWNFYVASRYPGVHTVVWNLTKAPDTLGLVLVDNYTGVAVDMKAEASYSYTNVSTSPRSFTVKADGSIGMDADAGAGMEGASDTNPPETGITTALPAFTNSLPIAIAYAGTDDVTSTDALEFSCNVDSGAWSEWTKDKSTSLAGLSDGSHTFSVKARDEAGNEDATPATISFAIDMAPPSLTLNTPEPAVLWPVGGSAAGGRIVEASQKTLPVLWPPLAKAQSVTITGYVSDAVSGLDGVSYTLSDEYGEYALSGNAVVSGGGGFSIVLQLMAQRLGTDRDGRTYTVTVTAIDKAGNRDVKAVMVVVPHDAR